MENNSPTQSTFKSILKSETTSIPVKCLGMTFPNDEDRRKFFIAKLKEKLNDPEFS